MKLTKTQLPGLEDKEIIESNPMMVKESGCGSILFVLLIVAIYYILN